jgi:hypothetical protein
MLRVYFATSFRRWKPQYGAPRWGFFFGRLIWRPLHFQPLAFWEAVAYSLQGPGSADQYPPNRIGPPRPLIASSLSKSQRRGSNLPKLASAN